MMVGVFKNNGSTINSGSLLCDTVIFKRVQVKIGKTFTLLLRTHAYIYIYIYIYIYL